MSSWNKRHSEISGALALLPERRSTPASRPDALLHQTILRCIELETARKELPPNLRRISSNSLSIRDFRSLATLSSSGPFNQVELVTPASSLTGKPPDLGNKVYVVKTVDRRWAFRMRRQQSIVNELAVLRLSRTELIGSPRIPRLVASFLSPTSFHLVLSHASGGDLWSLLEASMEEKDPSGDEGLPEEWVRVWIAELVDAVEWLHDHHWAHRDIKPHNLLLLSTGHLQLTDFGSVAPLSPASPSSGTATNVILRKNALALVGTPDYIAPEVLRFAERIAEESHDFDSSCFREDEDERAYGAEVDWWACGIVLYELLYGRAPFFAEGIAETYERIIDFQEYLDVPTTTSVSQEARDFIALLLVEPGDRPTAQEIKRHRWFRGVNWSKLRDGTPPYQPPSFVPPPLSPSNSFSHERQSSASSFTTFSNSFFSSPGLSILRPSPSTLEGAKKDETEYWEGAQLGGLATLPPPDEFESTTSPVDSRTATPGPPQSSPRRLAPSQPPLPIKDVSRFSYETPARPFRDPRFFQSTAPRSSQAGGGTPQTGSSARSRRPMSDVDAWKEMQEHAWHVGTSTKKKLGTRGSAGDSNSERQRAQGGGGAAGERGRSASARDESFEDQEEGEQELGSLEARHEEMVKELEEMGKKYGSLFELAHKEGKTA
ncbi:hypothetical protein JCM11491_000590 [Sporobolomyces phaffii]